MQSDPPAQRMQSRFASGSEPSIVLLCRYTATLYSVLYFTHVMWLQSDQLCYAWCLPMYMYMPADGHKGLRDSKHEQVPASPLTAKVGSWRFAILDNLMPDIALLCCTFMFAQEVCNTGFGPGTGAVPYFQLLVSKQMVL